MNADSDANCDEHDQRDRGRNRIDYQFQRNCLDLRDRFLRHLAWLQLGFVRLGATWKNRRRCFLESFNGVRRWSLWRSQE